jgi:hypothetical protein
MKAALTFAGAALLFGGLIFSGPPPFADQKTVAARSA